MGRKSKRQAAGERSDVVGKNRAGSQNNTDSKQHAQPDGKDLASFPKARKPHCSSFEIKSNCASPKNDSSQILLSRLNDGCTQPSSAPPQPNAATAESSLDIRQTADTSMSLFVQSDQDSSESLLSSQTTLTDSETVEHEPFDPEHMVNDGETLPQALCAIRLEESNGIQSVSFNIDSDTLVVDALFKELCRLHRSIMANNVDLNTTAGPCSVGNLSEITYRDLSLSGNNADQTIEASSNDNLEREQSIIPELAEI